MRNAIVSTLDVAGHRICDDGAVKIAGWSSFLLIELDALLLPLMFLNVVRMCLCRVARIELLTQITGFIEQ